MSNSAKMVTADVGTSRQFTAGRAAARSARHWATPLLASWGLRRAASDALVVLSELVTNAVFHGDGDIDVRLSRVAGAVRIEVTDRGRGTVVVRHPAPETIGGRGMLLVEHLSRSWGVTTSANGKTVWAEMTVA
jgi:anti-sigma regulatory factor (Ser/Thr protein kinase)